MIWLWCTRASWALLPVTTGAAFADATDGWSIGSSRLAAVFLWVTWAVGLFALFAPRPWGLTLLRVVAPCGFACVAVSSASTSAASAELALASSGVAAILALSAPTALAAANAHAYGDEQRFPLRIPMPLLLGPIPVAVVLVALGGASGPLLLADGRYLAGALATIVGVPVALLVVRALHPLACRWFVLVPAGIAIADPLTLTEPVLVRREHIATLRRTATAALPPDALDLRLGTLAGGIVMGLSEPVEFGRRRGRGNAEVVEPQLVAAAVVRADAAIGQARSRRISA
ncbi:MAG: hypothetical protein M3Q30_16190 [Actinomycetota bacterium]|nr:hypothetical protein [Actinomycetota bacterium]